jgi:hypothetical protein
MLAFTTDGNVPLIVDPKRDYEVRWFEPTGSVVVREGRCEVFVAGTLIGQFDPDDRERGERNMLMVTIAAEPRVHLEQLAAAFGVSSEYLRDLRRRAERGGLRAVWTKARGGSEPRAVTPQRRASLVRQFEQGIRPADVHRRSRGISRTAVYKEWRAWRAGRAAGERVDVDAATRSDGECTATSAVTDEQLTLPIEDRDPEPAPAVAALPAVSDAETAPTSAAGETVAHPPDEGSPEAIESLASAPVRSGTFVQHLGTWLLMAAVGEQGVHDLVADYGRRDATRVAVDAVIAALALGQGCVEGVRRIATPSAGLLLRAERAPTASWTRRVLHAVADREGAPQAIHLGLAGRYLGAARERDLAVFYVDNHLRPYTGKHVVRRGWRMQDRRVRPGATDYYVHDEDGRPVLRITVASHDALTDWLLPAAELLRLGIGPDTRILLAFDRAGAFPEQLAALRDSGFEFVTYERRPYPLLTAATFDETLAVDGDTIGLSEQRLANLGGGRGRVRRLSLRMPDPEAQQINLLAISSEPPARLVEIMMGRPVKGPPRGGRWQQENGFKHGVERWGMNQLDGRRVEAYPPETIIPNPARRRLDRALRLARICEGDARSQLARLPADNRRRARIEADLDGALLLQRDLHALRPSTPKRAPLEQTELAGKLVQHDGAYKTVLDTIRIACANAESELAAQLAPHLPRPAEAKKTLANLLAAPGSIDVRRDAIHVVLAPAATRPELAAFEVLLVSVNATRLTLPGDRRRRPLRFQLQLSSARSV